MPELTSEQLAELREDFSYNDANNDGRLSYDEFAELLQDLDAGMTENEARLGFREIDTDRDGAIEFEEFVAWWTRD